MKFRNHRRRLQLVPDERPRLMPTPERGYYRRAVSTPTHKKSSFLVARPVKQKDAFQAPPDESGFLSGTEGVERAILFCALGHRSRRSCTAGFRESEGEFEEASLTPLGRLHLGEWKDT